MVSIRERSERGGRAAESHDPYMRKTCAEMRERLANTVSVWERTLERNNN